MRRLGSKTTECGPESHGGELNRSERAGRRRPRRVAGFAVARLAIFRSISAEWPHSGADA
ncbi:hypothetical protein DF160_27095 [Burkholderia anthina]|nr:hypothetical protein DF160_27095 [Burkholderia anthina]WJN78934.1 hypothetical protein OH687_34125 [Burkholderia anthina]